MRKCASQIERKSFQMETKFKELHTTLSGRDVTVLCQEKGTENGRWALKTE